MSITWLDVVDSTNDEAKRQILSLNHLSVISAVHQTAGRGQRGNTWSSESGMNLTFSIVIKYGPEGYGYLAAADQFTISKIASLAVIEFLKTYSIDAKIKWPNDIYVNDKKIAGILIEHAMQGERMAYSIIGIGLNTNQISFDSNLFNPTSIRLEHPNLNCLNLHLALEGFIKIFKDITEHQTLFEVDRLYHSNLWRLDTECTFVDFTNLPKGHHEGPILPLSGEIPSPIAFSGIIRGVSRMGELIVKDLHSSKIHKYNFKEIGYII